MYGNLESHAGDHVQRNLGTITFDSSGLGVIIKASGVEGMVYLAGEMSFQAQSGEGTITITNEEVGADITIAGGELGTIRQNVGPPMMGSQLLMEPEETTITVGPIGLGASITLTPESITLRVAETEFVMTALGISETVLDASRELTAIGHELSAAETTVGVTVVGVEVEAPIISSEAEAASEANATLASYSADAMKNDDAGIAMVV